MLRVRMVWYLTGLDKLWAKRAFYSGQSGTNELARTTRRAVSARILSEPAQEAVLCYLSTQF